MLLAENQFCLIEKNILETNESELILEIWFNAQSFRLRILYWNPSNHKSFIFDFAQPDKQTKQETKEQMILKLENRHLIVSDKYKHKHAALQHPNKNNTNFTFTSQQMQQKYPLTTEQ